MNDRPEIALSIPPGALVPEVEPDLQLPESDQAIGQEDLGNSPIDDAEQGRFSRMAEALRHNKAPAAAGAITVASLVANPMGQTIHALAEVAPYVAPGMVAAEAAWIGGAAMMLAAIGKRLRNPLKIRSEFGAVSESTANSRLFQAGLIVNTAAALAECAIPTAAVTANLPVESWGILAFSTLDLWATVVLRRMIWRGMHSSKE